jgi:hypothetical protein
MLIRLVQRAPKGRVVHRAAPRVPPAQSAQRARRVASARRVPPAHRGPPALWVLRDLLVPQDPLGQVAHRAMTALGQQVPPVLSARLVLRAQQAQRETLGPLVRQDPLEATGLSAQRVLRARQVQWEAMGRSVPQAPRAQRALVGHPAAQRVRLARLVLQAQQVRPVPPVARPVPLARLARPVLLVRQVHKGCKEQRVTRASQGPQVQPGPQAPVGLSARRVLPVQQVRAWACLLHPLVSISFGA